MLSCNDRFDSPSVVRDFNVVILSFHEFPCYLVQKQRHYHHCFASLFLIFESIKLWEGGSPYMCSNLPGTSRTERNKLLVVIGDLQREFSLRTDGSSSIRYTLR
mmetsp:Transcript_4018/g.9891  ORF Transcript_4018/g.9891 Transcript_4018/m.9891 type:complete len:104 (-) Transcript_4018:37-348(-)